MFLSEFNLKLMHTPGAKMVQSDALFQWPDHVLNNNNNEDIILLPNDIFIKMLDMDLENQIQNQTMDDEFFAKGLMATKQSRPTPICFQLEDWTTENGLLFYKGCCYIPPDGTCYNFLYYITPFYSVNYSFPFTNTNYMIHNSIPI